jgi:hypothetical protein
LIAEPLELEDKREYKLNKILKWKSTKLPSMDMAQK